MPALPQVVNQQTISYQNIRVGAGSPNAIGQYGEPGWIYQDWTGGALYVCTVAGTAGWTLSSSGGQPSNPLLDAVGTPSVDFYDRKLFQSGGITAVDWENCYLNDPGTPGPSLDWTQRKLINSNGDQTVDWENYSLHENNGYVTVEWRNALLYDPVGNLSVEWDGRILYDASGIQLSVNWDDRKLHSSSSVTVDWSNNYLYDQNHALSVTWDDRKLRSTSGLPTVDWESGYLIDTNSIVSVDWRARELYNGVGDTTLDWAGRVLYDSNVYVAVNWNTAQLSSGEVVRVDWSNGVLSDLDGFQMLNWATGVVNDTSHDPTLNWVSRFLYKQWTTVQSGAIAGNVMSNAAYFTTVTTGAYNPSAPANAGMVIYHQSISGALIAAMTLQLHGVSSAFDSVPVGGDMSFTSRYGVTALTVTYGGNTLLGTPVTTCPAGTTITWRKLSSSVIARLT